ncbi:MAG TPA: hypothetical protein PKA02_02510 [Candidatus Saccharibacteria bacterium]|nr:hypothetical protein [Candidatus Saccharibacteria bacterium]
MERYLTDADASILARFRQNWRAAGWGVMADCHTDLPYGDPSKFIGALFHPDDHEARLDEQYADAQANYRSFIPSPLDREADCRPPVRDTQLGYMRILNSPNFVYTDTASGLCVAAVSKAIQLYPDRVPTQLAEQTAPRQA